MFYFEASPKFSLCEDASCELIWSGLLCRDVIGRVKHRHMMSLRPHAVLRLIAYWDLIGLKSGLSLIQQLISNFSNVLLTGLIDLTFQ